VIDAGITRRELLGAGATAGALALASDPLLSRALAATAPRQWHLSDIEHVVILIQENRSFDHYFGTFPGARGFGDPAAAGTIAQPGYPVPGFEGELLPFHLETHGAAQCFPDITHAWVAQHQSFDDGAMDGFVKAHLAGDGPAAGPATMGYYEREDIASYFEIAEAFTICDNYFCSVQGPTDPNRLYSMSGTIDPDGTAGGPLINTVLNRTEFSFKWTTMPEQLESAGISWKVYSGGNLGYFDNVLSFFENFQTNEALAAKAFKPVYPNDFRTDLERGELPQVSWIDASLNDTEHPGYSTAKIGEHAVRELIRMLISHGRTWRSTALFITWDENGGFFDHVAPPTAPAGTPGEYLTVPDLTNSAGGIEGPIGLGFRVPLIVASPFARGGYVCSDTFDHTSLLRFIETRFGVEVPNLSAWRRETTGDLTSAFNTTREIHTPRLAPVRVTAREQSAGGCTTSSPVQVPPNAVPVQEPGTPRRPSGLS
jgi:phospholipase C